MASKPRILCDACGRDVGLWQAAFTSECAHTFHLRCVSGSAACPECKVQWSDTPAVAPAPAVATPFSFTSTPSSSQPSSAGLFGQQATASSFRFSSSPAFTTSSSSLFGSPPAFGSSSSATSSSSLFGSPTNSLFESSPQTNSRSSPFMIPSSTPSFGTNLFGPQPPATPNPFSSSSLFGSSSAFGSSSSATSSPSLFGSSTSSLFASSPQTSSRSFPFTIPSSASSFGTSLFGLQPPATPNPFWLAPLPPTAQSSSSCSVCHGSMDRGQATVTSECNHTFHLRCFFSGSVCPVCSARWPDEVTVTRSSQHNPFSTPPHPPLFQRPDGFTFATPNPSPTPPLSSPSPPSLSLFNFNDDEPVEPPLDGWDTVPEVANNGVLVIKTHCEHPEVARDAAQDNFAVLVHAKAPVAAAEASARAPLDLITVLDVSSSMEGSKIALLKQAMGFVIDKLGPGDRLSVVTFSCNARRIIRLTRMSDGGKASARAAVESLRASGSTNIRDGLRVAAQVLDGRRHRNTVASIILLSDGQDNRTMCGFFGGKSHIDLVPHSLRRSADNRCPPVHTFGFGTDHDTAAMHAIAEVAGGTFSFIENQTVVQDSFAQCIGGLLSTAVQEARIAVESLHPGVCVRAVKSGCYESRVDADGSSASVDVGELYAEEERRFLLLVDVPIAGGEGAQDGDVTSLIKVSCTYKDAATGQSVDVAGKDVVVQRPIVVADMEPSVDVARERFRVEATEDIAASQEAAERGAYAEAARILERRQEASVAAGLAGDARCAALVAELRELSVRAANRREYEETGRACMLAGISSHAQQRASTVQLFMSKAVAFPPPTPGAPALGASPFVAFPVARGAPPPPPPRAPMATCGAPPPPSFGSTYATPAMQGMLESSRKRRQQQEPKGGSRFDPK